MFTNRVRVHQGLWRWTKQTFVWQVRPLAKSADCRNWGNAQKTLQMSGNKVYWAPNVAWRCLTDRQGRSIRARPVRPDDTAFIPIRVLTSAAGVR